MKGKVVTDIFYTSDLHFNHNRILEFTDRPCSSVEEMGEWIINQWNSQVKPGDTVYHMGDFCFGMNKRENIKNIVKRLNGNIFFICGNHDSKNDFLILSESIGGRLLGVEQFKEIKVQKKRITLCHFALTVWANSHHGTWHLYGHAHGSYEHPGKALDVGLDNSVKVLGEYRLFTHEDVKTYMDGREPYTPDHHDGDTT